jgi:vancomycin resistance protein VanJ
MLPPATLSSASNLSPITVMTFNLLWSNVNYDAIAQLVDQTAPDLLGLQEVRPEAVPILIQRFSERYPFHSFHPIDRFHNVGLLSRFPITTTTTLPDPPFQRGLQLTVQPAQSRQPLQVIVAHFTPNYPMSQVLQLAQSWYDQRLAQVEYLHQVIAQRQTPTVLLCDCNFTDTSQAYATMQRFMSDSFREAGWGLGHTQKGFLLPTSRLDYIWHSSELQTTRVEVGSDAGSDHLPLLAQLQWQ